MCIYKYSASRPQLVRHPNLAEHFEDRRVLGIRLKRGQVQGAMPVRTVGVLSIELVTLNHKFRHIAA